MPLRFTYRFLLLVMLGLTAACTPLQPGVSAMDEPPSRALSEFEQLMKRLGSPLVLPSGKAILVNVPAYELVAFEDGVPVMRSRIIVGSPRNPTPLVDTHVSRVTFRPTWRPTPDMIEFENYEDKVWPPGRNNPLGLAAVRLDPGMLVYLHDTNQRGLFARDGRALSHGCIRVQRWDELIAWIVERDLDWVRAMAETPPSKEVQAPAIPVLIRYLRVFPAADGTVYKHHDIYGLEPEPDQARTSSRGL
ncbi:L,D-transpeptidase family protein [Rhodovulum bhavnagarense]|uniref:L,D-transpeptidase family protein n=1 Tax=Rhodovulum bhavnagarense TaxID=992286 RepID=UPI00140429EF|nr:L,D-transpeptidase family protein [Rhodovulum bhavnagarense]